MTDSTPKSLKSVEATSSLIINNPFLTSPFTGGHLTGPTAHIITTPPVSSSPFVAAAAADTEEEVPEFVLPSSSSPSHTSPPPPPVGSTAAVTGSALDTLAYVALSATAMSHSSSSADAHIERILRSVAGIAINDASFSPKPFAGTSTDEDVTTWLKQFDRYAEFRALDEVTKAQLFKMLMRGIAAEWLHALDHDVADDYERLINAFTTRFALTDVQLCQKASHMWGREQQQHETVDAYITDIRKTARQLRMEDDNMLRFAIIRGLRPAIRLHVLQSNAETLEDVIRAARTAEAANQSVPDQTSAVAELTSTVKKFMESMTSAATNTQTTATVAAIADERTGRADSRSPRRVRFESSPAAGRSPGDRADYQRRSP